jgi:hypothetical protein
MTFIDAIVKILTEAKAQLTPQEIRAKIKEEFPHFYATAAHQKNVTKGHYQDLNHALLAQIYGIVRRNDMFVCDNFVKPIKVSLSVESEEATEALSVEDLEANVGTVYVLKTETFTRDGKEILKIGITTGDVDRRIDQLYTTAVPYRFTLLKVYQVEGFTDLEKALHSLLAKFRLSHGREFFTGDALPFVDQIVSLHMVINKQHNKAPEPIATAPMSRAPQESDF